MEWKETSVNYGIIIRQFLLIGNIIIIRKIIFIFYFTSFRVKKFIKNSTKLSKQQINNFFCLAASKLEYRINNLVSLSYTNY